MCCILEFIRYVYNEKKIESEGYVNIIMYRFELQNDNVELQNDNVYRFILKINFKFEYQIVSRLFN